MIRICHSPAPGLGLFLFLVLLTPGVLASSNSGALHFIVLGDWGTAGSRGQAAVAAAMEKIATREKVDFIVSSGDNFYPRGVDSVNDPHWTNTWEHMYSSPGLEKLPWYISLGNHDYMGDINAQIAFGRVNRRWQLPARYYTKEFSIDKDQRLQLVVLDTSLFVNRYRKRPGNYHGINDEPPGQQIEWLQRVLQKSRADWRIVIGHHPVYTSGKHGNTPELEAFLPDLLKKYEVQAYFSGHDHHLEHYRPDTGIDYFISGAGARTRKVTPGENSRFSSDSPGFAVIHLAADCLVLRFINEHAEELYRVSVPRTSGRDCPGQLKIGP